MDTLDTWTPLFSSIVASSVWGQPPPVKVVWITMLALKDKNGFVAGSIPGLARLSAVSLEECQGALEIFKKPDPFSKSSEFKGVKIQEVEGGWIILGHARFQKLMKEVSTKVGNAKRQRNARDRKRGQPLAGEQAAVAAENRGDQAGADRIAEASIPAREPSSAPPVSDAQAVAQRVREQLGMAAGTGTAA